jgi:hypothetical protein
MDKVQKNAFTDYNASSSEPFRLHYSTFFLEWLSIITKFFKDRKRQNQVPPDDK